MPTQLITVSCVKETNNTRKNIIDPGDEIDNIVSLTRANGKIAIAELILNALNADATVIYIGSKFNSI